MDQDGHSSHRGEDPNELNGDSYLVILYLLIFLFVLGIVGYGLCCGLPAFLARYCSCTTGRCCGLPLIRCRFDTAAYRTERETLQRLRDIRTAQRQQQLNALRWAASQPGGAAAVDPAFIRGLNGTVNNIAIVAAAHNGRAGGAPINPWSPVDIELRRMAYLQSQGAQAEGRQQPPFPDRASMWSTFNQLNSMGLIIIPQDNEEEEQVHIRERLSSAERKAVLEGILDFTPYHAKEQGNQGEEKDTTNEADAHIDGKESALEEDSNALAGSEEDMGDSTSAAQRTSIVFPAHEVPDVPEITCAICLDEFLEGDMLNSQDECPHLFHKDCLIMWLERHDVCPICRREMVTDSQWHEAHAYGEAETST